MLCVPGISVWSSACLSSVCHLACDTREFIDTALVRFPCITGCFGFVSCCRILIVLNAVPILVCLKSFVIFTNLFKHKPYIPIRPVINNMNAPTYKVAKHLVKLLNRHLTLKNQYSVKKSTNLATNLTKLKMNKNDQLITYDIKDLYANIPIEETLTITKLMLLKNSDAQITQQLITFM